MVEFGIFEMYYIKYFNLKEIIIMLGKIYWNMMYVYDCFLLKLNI